MAWIIRARPAPAPVDREVTIRWYRWWAVLWRMAPTPLILGVLVGLTNFGMGVKDYLHSPNYQRAKFISETQAEAASAQANISKQCQSDFAQWQAMPEGPEKAEQLAVWKKRYGTQNFHSKCLGLPRY